MPQISDATQLKITSAEWKGIIINFTKGTGLGKIWQHRFYQRLTAVLA